MTRVIRAALFLALAALAASVPAEAHAARGGLHGWRHHGQSRLHLAHRFAPRFVPRHLARRGGGGNASWYGPGFQGHRTASGERFNAGALTAAHRSLPFGTRVRVTNRANGRSVVVRINDRGPFAAGRSIDLAAGAARAIGMSGTSSVAMAVVR